MQSKKYTAKFKKKMVEEYLKQKVENPKLPIAHFAYANNLSDSTFNDWVVKYRMDSNCFSTIIDEVNKLNEVKGDNCDPETILIKEITDKNIPMAKNKVRMKYNGVTVEFDESLLERVLSILKSW